MKAAVWLGLVPGHMVVETVGRTTGKRRRTVVGCARERTVLWVVAEQGRHAGYVRNLEAAPQVRLRLDRHWRPATATIVDEDDPVARLSMFGAKHAALVTKAGTSLLSLRFDLCADRPSV
jgi:deazaflavin-dependent oxidoreductase (nitroreductase family)